MNTARRYHFANAAGVPELGRQLSRWSNAPSERRAADVLWYPYAFDVRAVGDTLRTGLLVQLLPTGGASRSGENSEAQAVVVEASDGRARVATEAVLLLRLPASSATGLRRLYAGTLGSVVDTVPASGNAQNVGTVLSYDAQRDAFLCHLRLGASAAQGDVVIAYGRKLVFMASDGTIGGYIYMRADGKLELDRGDQGQEW